MAYAKMESAPKQIGRGRFVVSEGVAPSEKILPDEDLPTLYKDDPWQGGEFFEVVLLKGTIVSTYQKTDGRYVATYCRGLTGAVQQYKGVAGDGTEEMYEDAAAVAAASDTLVGTSWVPDFDTAIDNTPNVMGETGTDGVLGSLGQAAKPIGVLARDSFRPFDKGDNEGIGFVAKNYVEWPLVKVIGDNSSTIFDNSDLTVGTYVKPDGLGRPVKFREGIDPEWLRIGQVIAREDLTGANANYDYGFLQYMQVPVNAFEEGLLRKIFEANVYGVGAVFGVRPNVDEFNDAVMYTQNDPTNSGSVAVDPDESGVLGVVRVNLINM